MKLYEVLEEKEQLPSVKTHSPKEIADKHGVSISKIKTQLKKGTKIELEHTTDKKKAREIALDHLTEFPDYYDRLEKVEEANLIAPNQSDKKAAVMGLPNQYVNKDWGTRDHPRREKVIVKDTKTGQVYGRRTIIQKRT